MSVAAGVPVLQRTSDLRRFLSSAIESPIDTVIVADNGNSGERQSLYQKSYPFDLEILDLQYDIGIGACRRAVAEACDDEYLLVVDNDMEVPHNIEILVDILKAAPNLGAVSGILLENERVRSGCRNLFIEELFGDRQALTLDIRTPPEVESVVGHPIAKFDFLTNAAIVKSECYADYCWDNEMIDREHLDFYTGHYFETNWEFAVCPAVTFPHHKQSNNKYRWQHRDGTSKQESADVRFKRKWGFDKIWGGTRTEWIDTRDVPEKAPIWFIRRYIPTRYEVQLSKLKWF
ncbi:glycosyltransferase family 2 protein [Haloglomus halophilum]|uniref:glycosyltransferase family 2 protein n=1 Tax=Haloglomus halophilum TaxID=2962672 RepID=UPI0020C99933|nr:glycosyltransferase [Haloglomus halophilum]